MTAEQSTITDATLIDILANLHRPNRGGPASLIASGLYDNAVAATLAAACSGFDPDTRAAEVARAVYRLGRTRLNRHADRNWSIATAVYTGAYPIAGYLLGHALIQLCRDDETLHRRAAAVADLLVTDDPQNTILQRSLDLDRHLTARHYGAPQTDAIRKLARIAALPGQQRLAGIGHIARDVMGNLSRRGHHLQIRETLRQHPMPAGTER
jgi:hypothetical protein